MQDSVNSNLSKCPLHNTDHALKDCRGFKKRSSNEQRKFSRDHNICFKSFASSTRHAKDCDVVISKTPKKSKVLQDAEPHQSLCTNVSGPGFSEKSCGKAIFMRVYPISTPEKS